MQRADYRRLDETLFWEKMDNGLSLYVLPKPGFRQTYANFCTRYGSVDVEFATGDGAARRQVPSGIAHFLEHKLFEKEDGDAFSKFARLGAQSNAYTTFDSTTYLFSNTSLVQESLETLLGFVQDPYFSKESVEKEKGIIAQEIRMYEDNASWRAYFGYLRAMFGDTPFSRDIAGTVESIDKITPDDLYACYHAFYHPSNMILFVAGPVHPERVAEWVEEDQAKKRFPPAPLTRRFYPPLSVLPSAKSVEIRQSIAQPRVLFGFKDAEAEPDPSTRQRRDAAMEIWMDSVLGPGSELYHEVINDGLADQGFGSEYESTPLFGFSLFGGNSDHPEELSQRVREAILSTAEKGISPEDFERTKRKAAGRFLALFDSPQGVANVYTGQRLRGADVFAVLDVLEGVTLEEVNRTLRDHADDERFAASIVWPEEGRESS